MGLQLPFLKVNIRSLINEIASQISTIRTKILLFIKGTYFKLTNLSRNRPVYAVTVSLLFSLVFDVISHELDLNFGKSEITALGLYSTALTSF